jgi:hypothetical protein
MGSHMTKFYSILWYKYREWYILYREWYILYYHVHCSVLTFVVFLQTWLVYCSVLVDITVVYCIYYSVFIILDMWVLSHWGNLQDKY